MRKRSAIKITLYLSLMFHSVFAAANDFKGEAQSNYKGEAPTAPTTKNDKVVIASPPSDVAIILPDAKYEGQVYSSDLYEGSLHAENLVTDKSLKDGFYVGLLGGYDSYKMRHEINMIVFQQNTELNASGMTYTLAGGYGRYFDYPLYLGAEFFYNESKANTEQSIDAPLAGDVYNVKSVILGNYGISLMPGIKIADSSLFYLRGGYTRLEVKTYESTTSVKNTQSSQSNGLHYGAGFEVNLYKVISLRGEYTHLNSHVFNTRVGTAVTPTDNQVMLGLVWHMR